MVAATLVLTATIYARQFTGRKTASGIPYDPQKLTAAYNRVPLFTRLLVCGKSRCTRVTVTDRMRFNDRIDLSERAAKELQIQGKGKVTIYE